MSARAVARQMLRSARVLTIAFAYLSVAYAYIQPVGYRGAYPTSAARQAFARGLGETKGLRLLYGEPFDLVTTGGYAGWRVGGVLAIAAAAYGLLVAARLLRGEEEAGRMDAVLAAAVGRRTAYRAAIAAVLAGGAALWLAESLGLIVGGLPLGGAAYLALATVSLVPVGGGIGALASQLAPTRRTTLGLGGATLAALFVLRVVADTLDLGGLRWVTPFGWAEDLRPFAGPRPWVLVLPLALAGVLLVAAQRLAVRRDIGSGLLPQRDSRTPGARLPSSPMGQALRGRRAAMLAWLAATCAVLFVLGAVSASVSTADVSVTVQHRIAALGTGSITTPTGYLALIFLFVVVAFSAFACAQVAGAREEEAGLQLEALLALPVSRARWLSGRLALALAELAALALTAGLCAWAGAAIDHAGVRLVTMLEAGANALPAAILALGVATLLYGLLPRAGAAIAYALLAVAFLWQLVGALLAVPHWLLDATPFAHVGLVPVQPFRAGAAALFVGLGAAAASAGIAAFRRRDLVGG